MNTQELDRLVKTVGTVHTLEAILENSPYDEVEVLKVLYVAKDKFIPTPMANKVHKYIHKGVGFVFHAEFIKGLKRYDLKEVFLYFTPYEIKNALSNIIDYNTEKLARFDKTLNSTSTEDNPKTIFSTAPDTLLYWDKVSGTTFNVGKGIRQLIIDSENIDLIKPSYKGLTKEKLEEVMNKIFANNKVLTKTFSHNYSKAIDGHLIIRDALIIITVGVDGEVRIGYSFHNPIEPYDEDKGLMIAEGRLAKSAVIGKLTCVYQDRLKYIAKQYAISVINKKFYDICDRIITNLKNQNDEASSSGSSGTENSQHVD